MSAKTQDPSGATLAEQLVPMLVKGIEAETETARFFNALEADKDYVDHELFLVVDGFGKVMQLARQRTINADGVPPFFTWDNQFILDEMAESYGFLIRLVIDLEMEEKRAWNDSVKKSSLVDYFTGTHNVAPAAPPQPVIIPQPQPKEGLQKRVRNVASRILSREQKLALSPLRAMSYDIEISSVMENYRLFQNNWNRFIAWFQPKLELKTIFGDLDPVVYWYHLSVANEFLQKFRLPMIGGAYASATKLRKELDSERASVTHSILQLAIERQQVQRARTQFGH